MHQDPIFLTPKLSRPELSTVSFQEPGTGTGYSFVYLAYCRLKFCLPMLCLPDSFISILFSLTQIKVSLQFVRHLLLMKGCTSSIDSCVLSDDLCFAQNLTSPLTRSEAIIPKCTHDFTIITVPFFVPDPSRGIIACASFSLFFSFFSSFFFSFYPAIKRRVGLHVDEIPTHKRFKRTLFIRTRQNMQIFRVIPFVKL